MEIHLEIKEDLISFWDLLIAYPYRYSPYVNATPKKPKILLKIE